MSLVDWIESALRRMGLEQNVLVRGLSRTEHGVAEALIILRRLEKRMSKIEDSVANLEAGIAANAQAVANVQAAISAEIKQLADAVTAGNTDGLADRLNAVADKLNAGTATLVQSTNDLTSDDAPVVTDPNAPTGDTGTDGAAQQ